MTFNIDNIYLMAINKLNSYQIGYRSEQTSCAQLQYSFVSIQNQIDMDYKPLWLVASIVAYKELCSP